MEPVMLTNSEYYGDTSMISHSMLCSLISYGKYGTRVVMPEYYYARHILGTIEFNKTDAMMVGTIVDEYFAKGPQVLDEYPVVSRRTGKDKNEITNSMSETIGVMINALESFKTFQHFIKMEGTVGGDSDDSILSGSIETPNGTLKLKGKVDFINRAKKSIVDLKTTGNIDKVLEDLSFRGAPILTARYIRQMAYYRFLADPVNQDFKMALAVVDENGKIVFIPIRKDILDAAWKIIVEDLNVLAGLYKTNFTSLVMDPFGPINDKVTEENIFSGDTL